MTPMQKMYMNRILFIFLNGSSERRIQRLVCYNVLLAKITGKNNTELSINNKAPILRNGVHIPMNSMHILII